MTTPDPIEAAIEAGVLASAPLAVSPCDLLVPRAVDTAIRAAAPILIQYGRELAAEAILAEAKTLRLNSVSRADYNWCVRLARGGEDE